VDAYNAPTIQNDLAVFDNQFGLSAPPSFSVINQNGGSTLPSNDSGWAGEVSLDVEWAHAIAPAANIVLVEANSATIQDLMAAVSEAKTIPSVSTVSMSWGGSEFESFSGVEFSNQTLLDPVFTTPAGHQGITFIAAAGDTGLYQGAQWPATSPNVLSIGGTNLYTTDQAGDYSGEGSWNGTSGGFSQYEALPTYQSVAAAGVGVRVSPDVAYDADPNTGFAVYDSFADQGYVGWQEVGGTSAGSPQWAALVAIADQGRALSGKNTLDGASGTLPTLYSLYSDPGTAGYANYTNYFNDIIDSGRRRSGASAGYDILTGLGTPKATPIVAALSGAADTGGTVTPPGGTVTLPASTISGAVLNAPPAAVVAGSAGTLKVLLTNTSSDAPFNGPATVTIYATTQTTLDSSATALGTLTLAKVKLAPGASVVETVKFTYSTKLPQGSYYLIASTNTTGTNTTALNSIAFTAVRVAPPLVDLATYFAGGIPVTVTPGHKGTANITVQNMGNVTATGSWSLALYASLNQVLDPADLFLASLYLKKITLAPGQSMTVRVHFTAPASMAAGTYHLIAATYGVTQPADNNSLNNVGVIATV
jgi:subtilase family serine protease